MTKKIAQDRANNNSQQLLLDDRLAFDAMRVLDALEEQLFGGPLDSIVTAEAFCPKRRRLLHEEDEPV